MKTMYINGHRVLVGSEARKLATPGSVHIDALMTEFALNYKNLPFIGTALFPSVPVKKESDKYAIFNSDRKQDRVYSTLRAPKSRANVVDWSHTTATYSCDEHALAAGVDDRERRNADAPIAPDQRATAAALIGIELAREQRIATLVTTAGNYAASHKETLAGVDQWSDDDSNPLEDKQTAESALELDAGVSVNTAVVPKTIFNRLTRHPLLLDAFKYTKGGALTKELIASYFDIEPDRFLVPGAVKNTAALGAAASLSRIWGDFVWFGFVDPSANSPLDGITFGKTFRVAQEGQDVLVREFRDDPAKTDWKEVSEIADEKITAAVCGFLYSDVMA